MDSIPDRERIALLEYKVRTLGEQTKQLQAGLNEARALLALAEIQIPKFAR
jgi:hypothetical protein